MFRSGTEAPKTHEDYYEALTTKRGAANDAVLQRTVQNGLAAIYLLLDERLPKPPQQ